MNKLIISFLLLFVSFAANAQDAQGSCTVPGTSNYISADVYLSSDAHTVKVANGSEKPVASITVVITADVNQGYTNGRKNVEVFRNTFYNIQAWGNDDKTFTYKGNLSNVQVKVYNPVCQ